MTKMDHLSNVTSIQLLGIFALLASQIVPILFYSGKTLTSHRKNRRLALLLLAVVCSIPLGMEAFSGDEYAPVVAVLMLPLVLLVFLIVGLLGEVPRYWVHRAADEKPEAS